MPAKERQQISFLGYSHFIQVNYLWIAFVITYRARESFLTLLT